jgi:hypothetical protein
MEKIIFDIKFIEVLILNIFSKNINKKYLIIYRFIIVIYLMIKESFKLKNNQNTIK